MTDIPAGYSSGFSTSAWSVEALVALIQAVLSGDAIVITDATITGSTIDSSIIGGTTAAAGHFTTLAATSTTALSGATTLSGTNTVSGATTVSGTLSATNTVTMSPASHNVVISPTGSGLVTINPATAGAIDNVVIGNGTPLAVHATTFTATGVASFTNASVSMTALPTADPHVIGRLWADVGVVTVSAG